MDDKIIVPRKLDDKVLEGLFLKIVNAPKDLSLELPLEIEYRGFGMLPKLLLVVFTWVRNKTGTLIIPIETNNEPTFSKFAQTYFGYVVLLTVWKNCDIENQAGESLKKAFRRYTSQFHHKIDFLEGLPFPLVCVLTEQPLTDPFSLGLCPHRTTTHRTFKPVLYNQIEN